MSGQDGDQAALNRVALGTQTVDVWKDARAARQGRRRGGGPAVQRRRRQGRRHGALHDPGGNTVSSILLKPHPINKDNLNVVLDAGWITKDELCKGVTAGAVAGC